MELADSCQSSSTALSLVRRETNFDNLINLLQSSFKQTFTTNAFLASLGTSFGISALMMATWILVRPYHSNVYAPKLRHADKDRAPPAIDKGFFSWLNPLIKCHEMDLVDKIGMDATIFLRFMRMCRSLFCVLAILGCAVMIPVNVTCSQKNGRTAGAGWGFDKYWYTLMSPSYTFGSCMWAHVIVAWVFDMIIMYFLWSNYREVVKLRRHYFESQEYVDSLHSRTLMVWHIPDTSRSEEGLGKLVSGKGIELDGRETVAIARNMKNLPELLDMHNAAVRSLEKIIAKYFKDPDNVPTTRPVCRPSKDDHSMDKKTQVDAIEYYRNRIAELEKLIAITRRGIDKRETLPYGFVSFPTISRAHITGKALRGKHPKGSSIKLASKPYDIIWDSLNRNKSSRRWNRIIGNVLFTLLSILYVIPNACIAVFLSNLNNIAIVWPEFATTLNGNPKFFAIVQGILAPTITSCVYLLLPVLMRRISAWQGDITKSQRERHVTHKLYVFFIINNFIVFALFGMLWSTVRDFVGTVQDHGFNWDGIEYLHVGNRIALALFDISTFWITYILQRNLGAILDLVQIVTLISNTFSARFLSPTPRQKIEWTAPPPFDYATYYNVSLFRLIKFDGC